MEILNLTPHAIMFVRVDGKPSLIVPASENLARGSAKTVDTGITINGIPVTKTEYGEVVGLPDPEEGKIYVVSALVAQRVPERTDVFVPSESVRDAEGRIIGCRSLGRI